MSQIDILSSLEVLPPPVARTRRSDPWTSHAAAASLDAKTLTESQDAVFACFQRYGPMHDLLFVEVYNAHRYEHGWLLQRDSGLRTRRIALVRLGLLADSGETVQFPPKKRAHIVWKVADELPWWYQQ